MKSVSGTARVTSKGDPAACCSFAIISHGRSHEALKGLSSKKKKTKGDFSFILNEQLEFYISLKLDHMYKNQIIKPIEASISKSEGFTCPAEELTMISVVKISPLNYWQALALIISFDDIYTMRTF